jgi:hypothetical protein
MADEKKPSEVVDPADATKYGYWGYQPVEKDRDEYGVEAQAKIAEEAAQGGARAEGVGTVDKSAADRQAVRRTSSKENGK